MEPSKIIEYIGFDPKEVDSIEKFTEKFDASFIKRDSVIKDETIVNAITGKRIGSIETELKKQAKAAGIEFEDGELKGKKIEDLAEITFSKVKNKIKDLESKAGQGNDEVIKEWQDKYSKLESKANDYKKSWESTQTEFEGFKVQVDSDNKNRTVNQYIETSWSNYKWPSAIDELKKEGFKAYVGKHYKVQLDEQGQPFVSDKDGNRIKSGKAHGQFKSMDEILIEEGTKHGVYAVTNQQGSAAFMQDRIRATQQQQQQQQQQGGRKIHPNAARAI